MVASAASPMATLRSAGRTQSSSYCHTAARGSQGVTPSTCNIGLDLSACVASMKDFLSPNRSRNNAPKDTPLTTLHKNARSRLEGANGLEPTEETIAPSPPRRHSLLPPALNLRDGTRNSCFQRIYMLFEEPQSCIAATVVNVIVLFFIILSCTCFVVETLPQYRYPAHPDLTGPDKTLPVFDAIEDVCIVIFTIEYVLRFISVPGIPYHKLTGRRIRYAGTFYWPKWIDKLHRFFWKPMNMIDILAILPYYISLFLTTMTGGFGFLRILRLARVFRVFKLGKYNQGSQLFVEVMRQSLSALTVLLFFCMIMVVLFGSVIYFLEKGEWVADCSGFVGRPGGCYARPATVVLDPELDREISPFVSIPQCFWWVFTTMTTVGYGDLYPTTSVGKLVGIITMVCGLITIALPITVIGANFSRIFTHQHNEARRGIMEKTHPITATTKDLESLLEVLRKVTHTVQQVVTTQSDYLVDRNQRNSTGAMAALRGLKRGSKKMAKKVGKVELIERDEAKKVGKVELIERDEASAGPPTTSLRVTRSRSQSEGAVPESIALRGLHPGRE